MAIEVTQAELLEALALAQKDEPDGQTVNEMAAATGVHRKRVLEALHALQSQGRLIVGQARRPTIAGKAMPIPVYTITKKRK